MSGPSMSRHDVLVPLLMVLVPAVIINLVVLTRATAPAKSPTVPTVIHPDRIA